MLGQVLAWLGQGDGPGRFRGMEALGLLAAPGVLRLGANEVRRGGCDKGRGGTWRVRGAAAGYAVKAGAVRVGAVRGDWGGGGTCVAVGPDAVRPPVRLPWPDGSRTMRAGHTRRRMRVSVAGRDLVRVGAIR